MADPGDRPGDAGDTGPCGDRGEADGGASNRTTTAQLARGDRDPGRQDRRGGRSASEFFHFPVPAGSWGSPGTALAGRFGFATRSVWERGRGPAIQRDCAGNGEEREEEMGSLPLACSKFLRQSFHEWAGHSIAQSVWARAYYQRQREHGKEHHAAVRALAFKWIRIVFRCWQDRVAYDETKYLDALAKRGSHLASAFASATFCV